MNPGDSPSVALAILHWKGRHHLETLLPSARLAVERYGHTCPVIVLDNAAREPDGDGHWIRDQHPWVEYVPAPANDYLFSYNDLFAARREEILVLLNNDVRLDAGFIAPLAAHFNQPKVFAVGAQSLEWEGERPATGAWIPSLHHGSISWRRSFPTRPVTSLFATGGFGAFRRQMVLEIGGFDRLFWPGYSEETDLCYRAWRRGWEVRYEPASVVWHRESVSMNQQTNGKVGSLMRRNHILFHWKHLSHEKATRWFPWYHGYRAISHALRGDKSWLVDSLAARRLWKERRGEKLPTGSGELGFDDILKRIGLPVNLLESSATS